MKRYAVIRGGEVFTVTETEDEALAESEGWIECDESTRVGDLLDGAAFVTPAPVTLAPQTVTKRQAYAALIKAGKKAQVEAALNSMAGEAGELARNDYYNSTEFHRNWPLIEAMKPILGWTDEDIDNLFITAASL